VLASLLRAGVIEVTYQGRRFRNHLDAQVRAVFAAINAFRSASFAPRKAPDLKTLVAAARRYEELTGEEVDVDEAAIAQAFQNLARAEINALLPIEAVAKANQVPVLGVLDEYRLTLTTIIQGASDDVVNILEGEGESFKLLRQQMAEAKKATDEPGLRRLHRSRVAVHQMWPLIAARSQDLGLETQVQELEGLLADGSYYRFASKVDQVVDALEKAFFDIYQERHIERADAYQQVIDLIKGLPEWPNLPEAFQSSVLSPLEQRCCHDLSLARGQLMCDKCNASIPQMESDLAAAGGLRNEALRRIQQFLEPEEKIEHIRIADVVNQSQAMASAEDVEELIERLREHLLKLIEAGSKVILE